MDGHAIPTIHAHQDSETNMTTPTNGSPQAGELETVKTELKTLQETVARLQQRLEQIEVELVAIRNMI
jgi:ubiquinone biosynthesis protein UbiJ